MKKIKQNKKGKQNKKWKQKNLKNVLDNVYKIFLILERLWDLISHFFFKMIDNLELELKRRKLERKFLEMERKSMSLKERVKMFFGNLGWELNLGIFKFGNKK